MSETNSVQIVWEDRLPDIEDRPKFASYGRVDLFALGKLAGSWLGVRPDGIFSDAPEDVVNVVGGPETNGDAARLNGDAEQYMKSLAARGLARQRKAIFRKDGSYKISSDGKARLEELISKLPEESQDRNLAA